MNMDHILDSAEVLYELACELSRKEFHDANTNMTDWLKSMEWSLFWISQEIPPAPLILRNPSVYYLFQQAHRLSVDTSH